MNRRSIYTILIALVATSGLAAEVSSLSQYREASKNWIEAEKVRSKEAYDWENERILLEDRIHVLERERASLKAKIDNSASAVDEAGMQRSKLVAKEADIEKKLGTVHRFLDKEASRIEKIWAQLPQTLRSEIETDYLKTKAHTNVSTTIGKRAQATLNCLDAIRQFNQRFTLVNEIRTNGEGEEQSAQVLYMGLAQAYYLTPTDAGIGRPSADAWIWKSVPGIADEVGSLIAIVQSEQYPKSLPQLPLKWK